MKKLITDFREINLVVTCCVRNKLIIGSAPFALQRSMADGEASR